MPVAVLGSTKLEPLLLLPPTVTVPSIQKNSSIKKQQASFSEAMNGYKWLPERNAKCRNSITRWKRLPSVRSSTKGKKHGERIGVAGAEDWSGGSAADMPEEPRARRCCAF